MELSPGLEEVSKDLRSGLGDSAKPHSPRLVPSSLCWVRFITLSEDIVPRICSCFQLLTHEQANANMVAGRTYDSILV